MVRIAVVALLALFAAAAAFDAHVYGVDVSEPVSESAFRCLKDANLTFAVVRCWHSFGTPDDNVVPTVAAAWAGGLSEVDVYMFPCPKCGDGAGQVSKAVAYLRDHKVKFNTFWFDIEGGSTYWGGVSSNVAFFEDMVKQAKAEGLKIGVYTSDSQWVPIMGGYSGGSEFPLWYAHYDGIPDFDDFSPFNGWKHPARKQFSDAGAKCGASYDINWYPPA